MKPSARAKLLDEWGVDKGVLFPTIGILPFPIKDMDLANAYCRAYNTWQKEFFESIPNRVIPIALVNWYDVEAAASELERCVKAGFRGLFIPPETIGDYRPGSSHFDPLWRICDEAGIPGCFHVIVRFEESCNSFSGLAWRRVECRANVFVRNRSNWTTDSCNDKRCVGWVV